MSTSTRTIVASYFDGSGPYVVIRETFGDAGDTLTTAIGDGPDAEIIIQMLDRRPELDHEDHSDYALTDEFSSMPDHEIHGDVVWIRGEAFATKFPEDDSELPTDFSDALIVDGVIDAISETNGLDEVGDIDALLEEISEGHGLEPVADSARVSFWAARRRYFENASVDAGSPLSVIERGKREIREDIASGKVPSGVESFSDLHSHVDANQYGGLADGPIDALDEGFVEEVQTGLDEWIKAGMPTDEEAEISLDETLADALAASVPETHRQTKISTVTETDEDGTMTMTVTRWSDGAVSVRVEIPGEDTYMSATVDAAAWARLVA